MAVAAQRRLRGARAVLRSRGSDGLLRGAAAHRRATGLSACLFACLPLSVSVPSALVESVYIFGHAGNLLNLIAQINPMFLTRIEDDVKVSESAFYKCHSAV